MQFTMNRPHSAGNNFMLTSKPFMGEPPQSSSPNINDLQYFTKCITIIWQTIIHNWELQNQHLYPHNHLQEDYTQLQAALHQIIHNAGQNPNLHGLVADVDPEVILAKSFQKTDNEQPHPHMSIP